MDFILLLAIIQGVSFVVLVWKPLPVVTTVLLPGTVLLTTIVVELQTGNYQCVLIILQTHAEFLLLPANAELLMNIQTVLNQTIGMSPEAYNFFVVEYFYNMDLTQFLQDIVGVSEEVKKVSTFLGQSAIATALSLIELTTVGRLTARLILWCIGSKK
jgi:hypothetical protein